MALVATKTRCGVADNFRISKSPYVTSADGNADYIVCELPKKALITFLAIDIKTAYTGSSTGTLTIGVKEPGVALSAAQLADDTVTLSEVVGMKVINKSLYFDNGAVITIGVTKGDSAANAVARVFVVYSVVH